MNYVVRTRDGELRFDSLDALREGFRQYLVDADDEVQEGTAAWNRVAALIGPVARSRTRIDARWSWVAIAIAGVAVPGVWAWWSFLRDRPGWGMAGIGVVVLVASAAFTRFTGKAFRGRARG